MEFLNFGNEEKLCGREFHTFTTLSQPLLALSALVSAWSGATCPDLSVPTVQQNTLQLISVSDLLTMQFFCCKAPQSD